jgi:hypothetical protein
MAAPNDSKADDDSKADELRTAEEGLRPTEIVGWLEGGAWITLLLAPFLYFVNGPAVSTDQWLMRSFLVTAAAAVAVGSCWRRSSRGHRSRSAPASDGCHR